MENKTQTINIAEGFAMFSEKQIEAIKLIVRRGFWGDCDQEFADKKTYSAYGYITNMKDKGKEWSGLLSGISKKIEASGTNLIAMCSDWWGDGSGDMRRKDEITSLLMTDGENANIKFNFVKGRGGNKGMNVTKPYSRKGKVG